MDDYFVIIVSISWCAIIPVDSNQTLRHGPLTRFLFAFEIREGIVPNSGDFDIPFFDSRYCVRFPKIPMHGVSQ